MGGITAAGATGLQVAALPHPAFSRVTSGGSSQLCCWCSPCSVLYMSLFPHRQLPGSLSTALTQGPALQLVSPMRFLAQRGGAAVSS